MRNRNLVVLFLIVYAIAGMAVPAHAASTVAITNWTKNNNIYTNLDQEFPHTDDGTGTPGSGVGTPNATFLYDPATYTSPDALAGYPLVQNGITFQLTSDSAGHDFGTATPSAPLTIAINQASVSTVYVLVASYANANGNAPNQSAGFSFNGTNGVSAIFNNLPVPDFCHGPDQNGTNSGVFEFTAFRVQNVGACFTGNSATGSSTDYDLVELSFPLDPALFHGQTLTSMTISSGTLGGNPAVILLGVTVSFSAPSQTQSNLLLGSFNSATSMPPGCAAGDPVNCATGNMTETLTDLFVPGRGRALAWSRTYNSQAAAIASSPGPLGYGWTDSYAESLALDSSGNATVTLGNGAGVAFTLSGGNYTAPSYVNSTLVKNADGTFTFTFKNQRADIFDSTGKLIRQTDRHAYMTTLAYDSSGNLVSVTDPAGRKLTVTTTGGLVTAVKDPMGRTVSYSYDANSNLISVTDVAGKVTQYAYDSQHQLISITDPLAHQTTITYDSSTRVAKQTSAQGRTITYGYSGTSSSPVTTLTLGDGNQVQETFNSMGELLSLTRGYGTTSSLTWTLTYDPATLARTGITDPTGHTTSATYDALGNLLTRTDPLGHMSTFTYNAFNDPISAQDAMGITTALTYDAQGTLLSVSRLTATTSYAHTNGHAGDVTAISDASGRTWHYAYDSSGNLTQITDPAGKSWSRTYNLDGWLLSSRTPLGEQTSFTRDAYGVVAAITDALGAKTGYGYDKDHNLISLTDADHHTTQFAYDADNLLVKVIQPDGSVRQSGYNGSGLLVTQTNGLHQVTTYTYDALERILSGTDPLNRTTSFAYDNASRLQQRSDPVVTASYSYDVAGELTGIAYSDGTPGVTFAYDALGRRTSMSDGTGASTFQWDGLGRLLSQTDGAGEQVGYSYDPAGRLLTIGYPANGALPAGTITQAYDAAGRLSSITDFAHQAIKFAYDADSRLVQRSYPNGIVTRFGFDMDSRLASISDPLFSDTFTRDPLGLITGAKNTAGIHKYTYTALNQLASDNLQTFAYDSAPELTSVSGVHLNYDAAGELTSALGSIASFTYDQRGDRVKGALGNLSVKYTYDGANRLTGYAGLASYSYSGDGLRTSKTFVGRTQHFVWNRVQGLPLVLEDGAYRYIYGPGGLPIEEVATNGATSFFHQDQVGSTRALSNSQGKLLAVALNGPYGELVTPSPLGFAGQYTDIESGLVYMRARYYDPLTAQFLTRDPLVSLTRQPYAYARGNPVSLVDPSGLDGYAAAGGAVAGEGACSTGLPDEGASSDSGYFGGGASGIGGFTDAGAALSGGSTEAGAAPSGAAVVGHADYNPPAVTLAGPVGGAIVGHADYNPPAVTLTGPGDGAIVGHADYNPPAVTLTGPGDGATIGHADSNPQPIELTQPQLIDTSGLVAQSGSIATGGVF